MTIASSILRRAALALLVFAAMPIAATNAGPPAHQPIVEAAPPAPTSTLQPVPGPVAAAPVMSPAPAPDVPLTAILAIVAAWLGGLGVAFHGLAAVLRAIAPHTKTTVDDRLAELFDRVHDRFDDIHSWLDEIAPVIQRAAEASPTTTPSPGTPPTADATVAAEFTAIGGPTDPPRSFAVTGIGSGLVLALLIAGAALQPGCATVKAAPPAAGHAIVDCAKADALPILALVAQLGIQAALQVLELGRIDWAATEAAALAQGEVVGGCAATRFVAALSAAHASPGLLAAGPDPGEAMLARLRARWGGVEWRGGVP